jgi:hypothetical protein
MTRDIRPLTLDDLPELSRFLNTGFHAPPEADFAAPEVLRWKYLESLRPDSGGTDGPGGGDQHEADDELLPGADAPRSYVARDEAGRIIGHVGLCRTAFEGQAITSPGGQASTMHIIDWLGSPDHRAVGMSLMRKAHEGVATQFGLGVSQAALVVGERAGYELRSLVPVYLRVLRAAYWLRTSGLNPLQRGLRLARHAAIRWTRTVAVPATSLELERIAAFGAEIAPIVEKAKARVILTRRDPDRLNYLLRFPSQAMSGWH